MTRSLALLLSLLLASSSSLADDSPLTLADLEAYRIALNSKPTEPAPLVRFRDLWDHPEKFAGKPVSVEGKVARLFRQPRIGEFPPLVEAWVVTPAGDPFCLVFPHLETPEIGALVRFSGTFVKRLRYEGGDTPRVAPLIVGPAPPSTSTGKPETSSQDWSSIDWMMGVGASVVVVLVLASRHFGRPVTRPSSLEPPPIFEDGKKGDIDADF